MKRTIAFISITMNSIGPMVRCIKKYREIRPVHYVDAMINEIINSVGSVNDECMGRMLSMIFKACQDKVDGIVLTCTMFSVYVPYFRKLFSVPIIGADVAMMEQAGKEEGKKALICTFSKTEKPSEELLKACCEKAGVRQLVDTYVLKNAFEEAQNENMDRHNQIIRDKVKELETDYDQIVLAQMSMADAVTEEDICKAKIYTSPVSACETILHIIDGGMRKLLGVIADDFTGAGDSASFLAKAGLKTIMFNGIPKEEGINEDCQAIVIALKTRTQETEAAVSETLMASRWLKAQGADQLYIKYCSTFDSTPKGNIGPIMDRLLEEYQVPYSILCPALPVNGRTVEDGKLFVNGVPLHESSMKNHPLTPMWDCRIAVLMEAQSKYKCINTYRTDPENTAAIDETIRRFEDKEHFYIVPDYYQDEDAKNIVKVFGHLPILSGGSGLLEELGKLYAENAGKLALADSYTEGAGLLLAGSCSEATRNQIAFIQKKGISSKRMEPFSLLEGTQTEEELWSFIEGHDDEVLVYSSDTPEAVKKTQEAGKEKIAALLESVTASLAKKAVEQGYTRIIVAGGETSGAVTKALGFDSYIIGESVAPGVPVMIPRNDPRLRLVLKSGNFGQPDFFQRALEMTGKTDTEEILNKKLEQAVWIGKSLFNRKKTSGSTANMSFRHGDRVYVSGSGACFGTLTKKQFSVIDLEGNHIAGRKPSKEYPLHLALYHKSEEIQAVIHTHSFYSTIWSCLEHENQEDCIPDYTPYLKMKLGTVGLIPYAKPGSEELFKAFRSRVDKSDGYLLKNHGPIVGGKDIMDAFYILEELEESARIAWELKSENIKQI